MYQRLRLVIGVRTAGNDVREDAVRAEKASSARGGTLQRRSPDIGLGDGPVTCYLHERLRRVVLHGVVAMPLVPSKRIEQGVRGVLKHSSETPTHPSSNYSAHRSDEERVPCEVAKGLRQRRSVQGKRSVGRCACAERGQEHTRHRENPTSADELRHFAAFRLDNAMSVPGGLPEVRRADADIKEGQAGDKLQVPLVEAGDASDASADGLTELVGPFFRLRGEQAQANSRHTQGCNREGAHRQSPHVERQADNAAPEQGHVGPTPLRLRRIVPQHNRVGDDELRQGGRHVHQPDEA
mmetsp:Transcript_22204/g.63680  ORF Transcript_22204/g.63680 Transcript_22204/m.63680 type:complete len:296 (+) Transcript_22204:216-1103(+)